MENPQKVVALLLMAVAQRLPVAAPLAMAALALPPALKKVLRVRLAQLAAKDKTALSSLNPAMTSLAAVQNRRLASGKTVQQEVATLPTERRELLFKKAVTAGLLPPGRGTMAEAEQAIDPAEKRRLKGVTAKLQEGNDAQKAANLRANLALRGPRV